MAKRPVARSTKKKNWYTIVAPKVFNEIEVGETSGFDGKDIIGRTVKSSLMNFTRNIKKQSITVTLKLTDVKEKKALTEISSFTTSPSAVKRMVRRRRDKVEDSFVVKTKDGKMVRVKPMVLTRSNASNSTLTAVRHAVRYFFINKIMKLSYGEFVDLVLNDRLVKDIKSFVSVIFPTRMITIRAFEAVENPKIKPTPLTVTDKKVYDQIMGILDARKDKKKASAPAKEEASSSSE